MMVVCFGAPQPRWFAISPKRSINGRTWQATNVSGLGQTQYYNTISWDGPCAPFHVVFGFRVHVHPIPGPWLDANVAAESKSASLQSIEGLWRMTATDHIQWCSNTTICAKGMTSFIDFRLSVTPTCLTHADALWWDRMHYGETECLKQRCVHQQVSDSSGWLMLIHSFSNIFKSSLRWYDYMYPNAYCFANSELLGRNARMSRRSCPPKTCALAMADDIEIMR